MPQYGNFTFEETGLEGCVVIKPKVFTDARGYFCETFRANLFAEAGLPVFVQHNQSLSTQGVLRGLHMQKQYPQGKLVRAMLGSVYDVAVDMRPGSPTYGKWAGVELSDSNMWSFFVPAGFAHGFLVLSETALFAYQCTDYYHPDDEAGIRYDDSAIGVEWPLARVGGQPQLSDKDAALPYL